MPDARAGVHLIGRAISTAGTIAWEKATRLSPRTLADVPVSPAAMSTEWLTLALCRDHPGAEVTSMSLTSPSAGTSTRAALTLAYNGAGLAAELPEHVFVKTSTSLTQRLLLGLIQIIEGETGFFNHVRPLVDFEAPVGYHAAYAPRTWRSVAIMEDVAMTKGAEFLNSTSAVGRDDVQALLTGLARMHGALWGHGELSRPWLKTPLDHLRNSNAFLNLRARSDVGARRARSVLPAGFAAQLDALWSGFERSMALASQEPLTFLHGDSHVGNTYRTASGTAGFSDWQVVMKGCWAYDVAYTIASALDVDDRRSWEQELLTHYLEQLALAGGAAPEFDDAWALYRQHLFYPYYAWAFTIGRSAIQPKMQPVELCLPIIERTAHALMDHDAAWARHAPR